MRSFLTSPFPKQTIITTDVIQLLADCEKEVIFHDRLIKEQQQWYRESSKQKRTTKTSYMHVAAWYHGTPPPRTKVHQILGIDVDWPDRLMCHISSHFSKKCARCRLSKIWTPIGREQVSSVTDKPA